MRRLRPSAAQERRAGVDCHKPTIASWGLSDVPRGGLDNAHSLSKRVAVDGRIAQIVLKNPDFRFDHNWRGR